MYNTPKKMQLWDVKNSDQFSFNINETIVPDYLKNLDCEKISPLISNCTRHDFLSGDDCKHIPIESDLWKQNQRTIMKQKINKLINENIF
jgi:hypothetical protein